MPEPDDRSSLLIKSSSPAPVVTPNPRRSPLDRLVSHFHRRTTSNDAGTRDRQNGSQDLDGRGLTEQVITDSLVTGSNVLRRQQRGSLRMSLSAINLRMRSPSKERRTIVISDPSSPITESNKFLGLRGAVTGTDVTNEDSSKLPCFNPDSASKLRNRTNVEKPPLNCTRVSSVLLFERPIRRRADSGQPCRRSESLIRSPKSRDLIDLGNTPADSGKVRSLNGCDVVRHCSVRYRKRTDSERDSAEKKVRPHSFVNSQEWTLSRTVPDLKLGILGTINSGKSALVHRYLTGSYMQEESPEGGRFKKEVVLDGQSYLLLIRDEGGLPEMQFTQWVDAVVFVFSLENESSFNAIYSYYAKMAHYHGAMSEVPVILVGTQDAISESNPRLIDDTRARKLASDLKRCSYYETCATYGLNVERVFQDACQKIVQMRVATAMSPSLSGGGSGGARSNTPNHMSSTTNRYQHQAPLPGGIPGAGGKSYDAQSHSSSGSGGGGMMGPPSLTPGQSSGHHHRGSSPPFQEVAPSQPSQRERDRRHRGGGGDHQPPRGGDRDLERSHIQTQLDDGRFKGHRGQHGGVGGGGHAIPIPSVPDCTAMSSQSMSTVDGPSPHGGSSAHDIQTNGGRGWSLTSLATTPIMHRKLSSSSTGGVGGADGAMWSVPGGFPAHKSNSIGKDDDKNLKSKNGEMGSGRVIPLKQGILYKKSSKPLSKEWKKKYVTLLDDGRLTYHPSLHDYMDNVRGKEINLVRTTVKIPGQRPKGSEAPTPRTNGQSGGGGGGSQGSGGLSGSGSELSKDGSDNAVVISNASLTPGFFRNNDNTPDVSGGGAAVGSSNSSAGGGSGKPEPPSVKKRQKRTKGGSKGDGGPDADSDAYEFMIVSLDNTVWHFDAQSLEERDVWVSAIEQQILSSLQLNLSDKSKSRSATVTDRAVMQTIRSVRGNSSCADCDAPNPDWASLNLGILVCIECSGIHRNIGTHITRVRSLDLDEWPPELVVIMTSTGNYMANSIWEANVKGRTKPTPTSSREEKEKWIRAKYELKEFLPPPPYLDVPLPQQLIDAVARQDVHNAILVLGYCKPEHVNTPYSRTDTRTALHIAAALGNIILVQLLMWYGANTKSVDHEGHNALFYARGAGSHECAELLRAQGCPENPTLPRRRISNPPTGPSGGGGGNEMFDKLPASVI